MKKTLIWITLLFFTFYHTVYSQPANDTSVYLLTCGPGTETYSIYGHSAIRLVIPSADVDAVYNWGVFDFNTPNFAWKFAKGRLDYMLAEQLFNQFMGTYVYEHRYVKSQKLNITSAETEKLVGLIKENLKPENINYRYDFFYDDCSTRIRDIFEKSIGDNLLYPPVGNEKSPTFRKMVAKYQTPYQWLQFGIDLIMGSTSDKEASFRDRMFLPIDMQTGLSEAVVRRSGKMIPLLQNPQLLLDFEPPAARPKFLTSPVSIFTLFMIVVIILSGTLRNKKIINLLDILIFSIFSILAILMIFFNFFTDHQQMKWNLNILWLNPFLLMCLASLVMKKTSLIWFRIVFWISAAFLILQFVLPQSFNIAILPLVIILIIRSVYRSEFEWNPLTKTE